ncbi:MAG: alpha/beta hydrolase [Magnetococcus sp. YQC-5]
MEKNSPSYALFEKDPALDPEPKPGDLVTMDDNDNRATQSVHYCETDQIPKVYKVVGSDVMLKRLKDPKTARNILIYIHGFNNLPDEILDRAWKLQKLCNKAAGEDPEKQVEVIPIIWPCDNDIGIIKDYWDDQQAAKKSGISFSRLLARFMAWRSAKEQKEKPCYKRINIISHSMGNFVLMRTLQEWGEAQGSIPQIFRNVFMMAADIPNEALEDGEPGEYIPDAARNVVVYYAGDDMAMTASKVSNVKNLEFTRRLGHTGPERMSKVPENVYAVDCDSFNNDADGLKGHAYFMDFNDGKPTPAFTHMFDTMTSPSGHVVSADIMRKRKLTL